MHKMYTETKIWLANVILHWIGKIKFLNYDVFDCNFVFHRTILFFYFQEYTCQISAYTPTDLTHSVKIRGDYLDLYEDDD